MFPSGLLVLFLILLLPAIQPSGVQTHAQSKLKDEANVRLLKEKSSDGDLEIGGELAGLPPKAVRYVRYEDLLQLPQETFTVADDTNFKGKTEITGVALKTLAHLFGQASHSDLIVAICYDKYRSNYPSDYVADHHPILVLKINGQLRDKWPPSEYGGSLGPYLISHPTFKPSFKILSHEDEPQIPFGVNRLEFRTQNVVFRAIEPEGKWPKQSPVEQGYAIARQDCFRCHGINGEGGELASRSWLVLASWAESDPTRFKQYIHDPISVQPNAKMPAHKDYDDATLSALTEYFATFAPKRKNE